MPAFVDVAKTEEVPEGEGRAFEVAGRTIAVFRVGERYHAVDNDCPHRLGPLAEGEVLGDRVRCPLHGWAFDLATGECLVDVRRSVRTHPVRVEGDRLLVEVERPRKGACTGKK